MRILITGITGMVGSHLAEYILANHSGVRVHGLVRWRSPLDNLHAVEGKVTLHQGDLRDMSSLIQVMEACRPDRVFHLAAQSYVSFSFQAPADTLTVNTIGTANLLEAIRHTKLSPRIHLCSSSEVYGQVNEEDLPISESAPLHPASPYAVSKVGEDLLAQQYYLSYGMDVVRTRMFTHTGPRRGAVFAEAAFAKQIAEVEAGIRPNPIRVGNLDSVRTFADVRDAVIAYWQLLERCPAGAVYNIGGNRTATIGEMLEMLKGMASTQIEHEIDPTLLRPSDVTMQIPDTSQFQTVTGWQPSIPLERTLEDLLNYYREQVRMHADEGGTE